MPRRSILHTGLLLCLVGMQAWLVYRVETFTSSVTDAAPVLTGPAAIDGSAMGPEPDLQMALLARIDARLAALERARAPASATVPSPPPIVAGSPDALAADRKLAAMVPQGPITDRQLTMLQAQIGQLPPDDFRQVSAALARAINSGQVQVRPQ